MRIRANVASLSSCTGIRRRVYPRVMQGPTPVLHPAFVVRAQGEENGEPNNNTEDEMIQLNQFVDEGAEPEGTLGPLAVMLCGFSTLEITMFRSLMKELEADMVGLVTVTAPMLNMTLKEALDQDMSSGTTKNDVEAGKLAGNHDRIIVLSGMYQSEIVEMVDAFSGSGLPDAAICCVVENNYNRVLKELFVSVMADHTEAMAMAEAEE